MARFYDTTYDPAKDSGTSGAEISDINPEQAYDVDLRRLQMDKRGDVEPSNEQQGRARNFLKLLVLPVSIDSREVFQNLV